MRLAWSCVLLLLAACADEPDDTADAGPWHTDQYCYVARTELSCVAGVARITGYWDGGTTSATLCSRGVESNEATCANGCAIEGTVSIAGTSNDFPWWLRSRASALCADAPSRNNGDPCDFETDACLPTRPVLNPDGTVMGHTYLRCVPQTSQCAPEEWPVIASYLEPCGAAVETQYGGPGINGVVVDTELVTACLLTWDEATQSVKSGFTRTCLGDWQCPLYSLCDAQIPELLPGGPATVAICKRGPRGMLTPDLLVP